jgi:putative phage-type endonuclease
MTSTIDRLDAMGHGVPAYGTREDLGDAAWLDARRSYLGASECAAVLGLPSYSTARDVWERKTQPQPELGAESLLIRLGRASEPVLLEWYAEETGAEVVAPVPALCHPDDPWLAATCDGVALEDRSEAGTTGPVCLEIKASGVGVASKWRAWLHHGKPPAGSSLVGYWVQAQIQCYVTGHASAHIYALMAGTEPVLIPVLRSDAFLERAVPQLRAWWQRHIVDGEEPPSHLAEAQAGVASLDPSDAIVPDSVRVDPEAGDTLARVLELQASIKADKAELDRLKGVCAQRAGTAARLSDGGRRWMRTTVSERRTLDAKRLRAERPDIAEQYTQTSETRRVTFGEDKA